jgi:hypothetical protein
MFAAAVVLSGMTASTSLVWLSTQAAFSTATANPSNAWTAGTVTLSDDDTGAALFNATGLSPGGSGTNCLAVTYTGTLAAAVRLYSPAHSDPSSVAQYLDLTIQEGTGAGFGSCSGFNPTGTIYTGTLGAFIAASSAYPSGVGTWTPSGPGTLTYRISYSLNPATPAGKQGASTSATLQWESRA